MWTPRRVLLLLAGLFGFGAAYLVYASVLGRVDGLPQLPDKYLPQPGTGNDVIVRQPTEPAGITRLREAFGADAPELDKNVYPIQIEDRAAGIVLACGAPPPIKEPTEFIKLAPFSLAAFGKPRPPQDRLPGEATEISVLHADEAILQLDRKVKDTKELLTGRRPAIIGIEMRAAADNRFNPDRRAGRVQVRNNQRFADPNRHLEFRTPGPLFYRSADHPDRSNPQAPHLWTFAAVEVVNRDNLPRALRRSPLPAAPYQADESPAKAAAAVSDMILGTQSPPPTVTAVGMKVFMKPSEAKTKGPKPSSAFGGVRELVLNENVIFHLWTDGGGFPGGAADGTDKKTLTDTPLSLAALAGGLADGRDTAARLSGKSLVTIRTLGPFRYDWDKSAAQFDIAPQATGNQPNTVELTRLSPAGNQDFLSCERLEILFNGPILTAAGAAPVDPTKKAAGPGFKMLRATGQYVLLSASAEELQAQGTFLEYTSDQAKMSSKTVLRGQPVLVKKGPNQLMGGSPTILGLLTIDTIDPPQPPGKPSARRQTITVVGPGGVDLYDEATKARTLFARWQRSLTQTRDKVGDRDADLLVFDGDGTFGDTKGEFHLTADTLRLWLQPGKAAKVEKAGQPLPARLTAVGRVRGRSTDAIIENTDLLNIWFQDTSKSVRVVMEMPTPPPQGPAAKPVAPDGPQPVPFLEPVATVPRKETPLHLSARSIDVTLSRFPGTPAKPQPGPAAGNGLIYELHKAVCEDRVVVHQDAAEPHKVPRGLDITAAVLHLDNEAAGYRMKATGSKDLLAEVAFEKVFIAGPAVGLDQPNNRVRVDGRGRLRMPASGGLTGRTTDPNTAAELVIDWSQEMEFLGAKRAARFVGRVQAVQRTSDRIEAGKPPGVTTASVLCHLLDVGFDRPVYFNQLRTPGEKKPAGPKQNDPKLERVAAEPMPEDAVTAAGAGGSIPVEFRDETISKPTGKPVKASLLLARSIRVDVADERTVVDADGPGETRNLDLGAKDTAPGEAKPADGRPSEQELKLTAVQFRDRLRAIEQKDKLKQAIYRGQVVALQFPADSLVANASSAARPPKAFLLRCVDTLSLSEYREAAGVEPRRSMKAEGQAQFETDDHSGDGHTIESDGTWVTLNGYGDGHAILRQRDRSVDDQDYLKGNPIKYNLKTKQKLIDRSSGGSFSGRGG